MKVLLVIPTNFQVYGSGIPPVYPPMGILYIASMLESHGHDLWVIDIDAEGLSLEGFSRRVEEIDPEVVGLSCVTASLNHGFKLAEAVKNISPDIITIMGGIHPTIDPENTIRNPAIDIITIGEAEHTIVELMEVLEDPSRGMENVRGIYYKEEDSIRKNPPRELESNLDVFPFPAFHLIKNLKVYSPGDAQALPALPIIISRGCPGRCTYCCTNQIFGRRFHIRSVENIVSEIDMLVNKYGAREVHFLDDSITTNRQRILDLCRVLARKKYPIKYQISNGLRADMINREILEALKSIGVTEIGFGVESGNEEILKSIKKGISKDQYRRAAALAKSMGFDTWGFFIIGLPGETAATIQETIDFAIELDPCFAKFLILKPFPGSEVFEELNSAGLIDSFDYDRYGVYTPPVHHLPTLSSEEILAWQKKAFRKFYFRPWIILRHIARIRSLTQLKIDLKGAYFVLRKVLRRKKIN